MLRRDRSVSEFWMKNAQVLEQAWCEWPASMQKDGISTLPDLDDSLYDPKLRRAIEAAWKNPSEAEHLVQDLWEEVSPGVYQCQFFDPDKIHLLRSYLDQAADAQIPTRPPYGIVLNRRGFMMDKRSVGYLGDSAVSRLLSQPDGYLHASSWRPVLSRLHSDARRLRDVWIYHSVSGRKGPVYFRQHSDSSALTLNINLNLPDGEDFSESSLFFVDPATGKKNNVEFAPGVAVMHRGATPHAALPITSGERSNLVLWLYGKNGHTAYYPYDYQMGPEERWTKPTQDEYGSMDTSAPF